MKALSRLNLDYILQMLSDIGNIRCQIYDERNTLIREPEGLQQAYRLPEQVLRAICGACLRNSIPTLWRVTKSVFLVAILLEDGTLLVIGPVCAYPPEKSDNDLAARELGVAPELLETVYTSASVICQAASAAAFLASGKIHSQDRIFSMNSLFADIYVPEWLTHHVASTEENRFPYEKERQWLESIARGRLFYDDEYIRKTELAELPISVGKFASTPQKQAEYLYVSAIVLASRAMIEGGVSPFNAYELEETFLQRMSEAGSVKQMRAIFIDAIHFFSSMVRRTKADKSLAGLVARCKVYVDKTMYEKITVRSIAEELGVSPNHLSAVFTKSEGITLTQYIHNKRLDRARELLRYSTMSIGEISEQLMFSSQSHFSRMFRERFERTPSEYRKRHGWKKTI